MSGSLEMSTPTGLFLGALWWFFRVLLRETKEYKRVVDVWKP